MAIQHLLISNTKVIELDNQSFQVYMMPDGDVRIGVSSLSLILGLTSQAIKKLISHNKEETEDVNVIVMDENENNSIAIETLSIEDTIELVAYEAVQNHSYKAIRILAIFFRNGIHSLVEKSNQPIDNLEIDLALQKEIEDARNEYMRGEFMTLSELKAELSS